MTHTDRMKAYVETAFAATHYAREDLRVIDQADSQQFLSDVQSPLLQLRIAVESLNQASKIARSDMLGRKFRQRAVPLAPDPFAK